MQWDFEDGSREIVRPSGIERKKKGYCFAYAIGEAEARRLLGRLEDDVKHLLQERCS